MAESITISSPCPNDAFVSWTTFSGICIGICISYTVSLLRWYWGPTFSSGSTNASFSVVTGIHSIVHTLYKVIGTKSVASLPIDTVSGVTSIPSSLVPTDKINNNNNDYIHRFNSSLSILGSIGTRQRYNHHHHNPELRSRNSSASLTDSYTEASSSMDTVNTSTSTTTTTTISILPKTSSSSTGSITLIGAGPGSPDLLTLAAYEAIRNAEVVICDKIASSELKSLVPSSTALVLVADKIPGKADIAQTEVNMWGIQALQEGKRVVRLKVGDPFLYGRGGEEVLFYRSYGYEPDIIPGVSSALVAPLVANIPVTHRGIANQLLISTGQGQHGVFPDLPVYDPSRTVVLLMAIGRIPLLVNDLHKERAYPLSLPIAIIERATQPDQRIIRTTLELIQLCSEEHKVTSPAVLVIGNVVNALDNDALVCSTRAT